jgi:hypothetical protein
LTKKPGVLNCGGRLHPGGGSRRIHFDVGAFAVQKHGGQVNLIYFRGLVLMPALVRRGCAIEDGQENANDEAIHGRIRQKRTSGFTP